MATDCDALMSKLNVIESRLGAMESKFILKSERSNIIEEAVGKIKSLLANFIKKGDFSGLFGAAFAGAIVPYALKSDVASVRDTLESLSKQFNDKPAIDAIARQRAEAANQKATEAKIEVEKRIKRAELDTVRSQLENDYNTKLRINEEQSTGFTNTRVNKAKYEVLSETEAKINPVRSIANTAKSVADTAIEETKGIRGLYNELNGRFVAFQNKIVGAVEAATAKAGTALTRAAKAIGISEEALSVGSKALGIAFDVLGKVAIIFQIVDLIWQTLVTLDLRARVSALENQFRSLEQSVSLILGKLLGIQNRLGSLEGQLPEIRQIAQTAQAIAKSASEAAQSAASIASSALATAAANAVAIAGTAAIANAAKNTAQQALNKTPIPGPKGERGLPGIAGRNGKDGKNGLDGKPGRNGVNGKDGLPGKPITIIQRIIQPMQRVEVRQPIITNNQTTIIQRLDDSLLRKIDATTTETSGRVNVLVSTTGAIQALSNRILKIVEKTGDLTRKTWDFLQIDRVLSVLTYVTTVHNAYFLSRSIGDTLFFMVDNCLSLFGINDADGNPINTSEIVNHWVQNAITTLIGEKRLEGIKAEWAKYNRIYQAAMNMLYIIQSMSDSSRAILETVGNYVARIGNALKRSGSIIESSYGWMNERMDIASVESNRWERAFSRLDELDTVTSDMAAITSEVVSLKQMTTDMKEARTEFKQSLQSNGDYSQTPTPTVIESAESENKLDSEAPLNLVSAKL